MCKGIKHCPCNKEYQLNFETEPFEVYSEFDEETKSFDTETTDFEWEDQEDEYWEQEAPPVGISRNNKEYIRWVQSSLNKILGLNLAIDGVMGPQTRSAIRSFQQKNGLIADGIIGPKTESTLIARGAGSLPDRLGVTEKPGRIDRCIDVGPLGAGFQRRPTGYQGEVVRLISTPDKHDILLIDFDIDDDTLKSAHTAALDDLLKFMAEDFARRKGPSKRWTVHIDGRASRTGTSEHNRILSKHRASRVQRYMCFHLFDHVRATDQLEFEGSVDFNTEFNGFDKAVEPGESSRERSVRVAVTRPGFTPPPLAVFPGCRFFPTRHGFKFDNSFSLPPSITKILSSPPISTILSRAGISIGTGGFGLCGGMVTAARDHFLFGVPIPPVTSPPPIGSSLFNNLVNRQLDSLNLNLKSAGSNFGAPIFKFATWMKLPRTGTGSVAELTALEFRGLRAYLAHGRALIMGLFTDKASKSGALTDNHQVLARCLIQRSDNQFAIHIYDPNFHDCDDVTLEVELIGREAKVTQAIPRCPSGRPRHEVVRGFFVMPYRPVKP